VSKAIRFTKMHAAGNDYVLVDREALPAGVDVAELARAVSRRRSGIGSDGLIVVAPSSRAVARMEMYNADGSRSAMCGNGIRLVAKHERDRGRARDDAFAIETDSGLHQVELDRRGGEIVGGRAAMGRPVFDPARIPLRATRAADSTGPVSIDVDLDGRRVEASCLSMGNPHAVLFVSEVTPIPLERWGAHVENDARFPERTNVEFVAVRGEGEIHERTWERGAGETDSCGSGACAAVVAAAARGATRRRVRVVQRGGELEVEWTTGGEVLLRGTAETVFEGEWRLPAPPDA